MNSNTPSYNEVGLNYTPRLLQENPPMGKLRRLNGGAADAGSDADRLTGALTPKKLPLHKVLPCLGSPTIENITQLIQTARSCRGSPRVCAAQNGNYNDSSNYELKNNNIASFELNRMPGYNGNYEGDVSMLGGKQQQQQPQQQLSYEHQHDCAHVHEPLCISRNSSPRNPQLCQYLHSNLNLDTESEQEDLLREHFRVTKRTKNENLRQFMCERLVPALMSQQRQDKLKGVCQRIGASAVFQFILLLLQSLVAIIGILAIYVFRTGIVVSRLLANLWRGFHLRNTTRNVLWHLILARCGDLGLFTLIVCTTPWIFAMGIIGFIIAISNELKKLLFELCRIVRVRCW